MKLMAIISVVFAPLFLKLWRMIKEFDANGDGKVSANELFSVCRLRYQVYVGELKRQNYSYVDESGDVDVSVTFLDDAQLSAAMSPPGATA